MRKAGFTLIELMIVIGMISLLAALIIPNFLRAKSSSMLTTCEQNQKSIAIGLEMYSVDNQGHYPPTNFSLLTPNYLQVIPTCPSVGTDTYTNAYTVAVEPDAFTFCCSGSNHFTSDISANFPQYASAQGLITGK